MRKVLLGASLLATCLFTPAAPAETPPKPVPVVVNVVGHGEILVLLADGATQPCDSSDNRPLFKGPAKAGDQVKAVSTTGSVCVDHTYGTFRESQWAGPAIWTVPRTWPGSRPSSAKIEGTVSTETR
jgi:hypothetical protein